jgi:PAS domain S-box-containing protein
MNDGDRLATQELLSVMRGTGVGRGADRGPGLGSRDGFLVFDESAQREFENSASPMRIFDIETLRYLAVNAAAVKFYGYTREEFLKLTVRDTRHPEDRGELESTVAEQTGYLRHRPACRQVKKSGEVVVVERITQDVLFNGRNARLTLTIDITGRIRTQELLWRRQQEFEMLAENSPDIVSRLDRNYRHLYVNPAVTAATGRSPDEFIGRTVAEVGMSPELTARWYGVLNEAFATEREQSLECTFTGPNGEGYYESRIIPERGPGGGVETVLVVTRDFTKRKKAENEVQRQKNLLAAIIDNLPMGVFIRDADSLRYVVRNRFLEKLNGYSVDTSVGKTAYDLFPKEQADRTVATDRKALESGEMVEIPEQEMLGRSGEQRVFHVRKVPLFGDDGRPQLLVGIADDITERKKGENELRRQKQLLEAVIDNIPARVFIRDAKTLRYVMRNRFSEEDSGHPIGSSVGKTVYDLHPKEIADLFSGTDMQALQTGRLVEIPELKVTRRAGELRIHHVRKVPIFDENGKPWMLVGISNDITARKHAEQQLRETNEFLRSVIESSRDCIKVLDLEGRLLLMNTGGCNLMEIDDIEPLLGSSWLEFWHGPDHAAACAAVAAARDGGSGNFEGYCPSRKGTPKWWDVVVSPILDAAGKPAKLLAASRDITARRLAQTALRESEERFRQLAENIRQVFWINALAGDKVIYVSPAYEEIWGKSRESLYRNSRSWMESIHPDDLATVQQCQTRMARGDRTDVEYRIIRPDGTVRWIKDRSYSMKAGDGSPLACGIAEDITDLKLAEQEKLTHAIHQRDALVREVHHRIKNSLQGVVGLLRQKIRKYPAVAPDIEEAIGQLQSLALVYGLQETRPDGLLSLAEITDAICSSAEKLIGGRVNRTFERVSQEQACIAGAEAVSVAVALNELVFNALKHQPAQAGRKRATVKLSEGRGEAEIRIANRGQLPKSFNFPEGSATGYGLGLVRTLLAPPGGKIVFNGGRDKVEVKLTLAPPLLAGRRKTDAK